MPLVDTKEPSMWGGDTRAPVESGNYLEGFQYDYSDLEASAAASNLYNAPKYLYNYSLGALGKGLFWIDRPYTAIMSGFDAAITNGDIFKEAWRGLSGKRQASFETILEDLGADPDSGWTTAAGIGLDFFPGMFLDPVNYLSFGAKGILGTALKGSAKTVGVLDRAKFTPEFIEAVESLGKIGKNKRADLARKGLYGMNVRLPYAPVVGKYIEEELARSGDWGKRLTREGFTVTPRFVNEKWAQGLDTVAENPYFMSVNDKIRKTFGGMKYALDKAGLTHINEFADILRSKQTKEKLNSMVQESELTSQMTDVEKMFKTVYGIEMPWAVNAGERVPVGKIIQFTPEQRAQLVSESNRLIEAQNKTAEVFNRGMIAEIHGIRDAVDGWASSRKRVVAIPLDSLHAAQLNQSLSMGADIAYGEARRVAATGGDIVDYDDYVEAILSNPDRLSADMVRLLDQTPEDVSYELASQWSLMRRADEELAAQGGEPLTRVRFLAFAPTEELQKASSQILVRGTGEFNAPKWVGKSSKKENGWYWLWKRGEIDDEAAVWRSFGKEAPEDVLPQGFEQRLQDLKTRRERKAKRQAKLDSGAAQLTQRRRTQTELEAEYAKIGQRGAKREAGEELEFTADIAGRDTVLFEIDAFDTLTPEFSNIGGKRTPLDIRKQRIHEVLDKLESYVEDSGAVTDRFAFGRTVNSAEKTGDAHALIQKFWASERSEGARIANETIGKAARKEWVKAAKAAGLDPDDATTQMILESIYLRRIAYTALPGNYTANALAHSNYQAARALFGGGTQGEVLDPVALWWTNTEELRRQLDVVERQIGDIRNGTVPINTKLEALTDEEIEQIRNAKPVTEQIRQNYDELNTQISDLRRQRERWMDSIEEGADEELDFIDGQIEQLENKRFVMELTAPLDNPVATPTRDLEARYMMKLLKKRDDIASLLQKQQDPFLTAKTISDELAATRQIAPETLRRWGYDLTEEEIEGMKFSGPELERLDAARGMMEEIKSVFESAHRELDPKFRMPIENYMLHQLAVNSQAAKERQGLFQAFKEGRGTANKAKAIREYRKKRGVQLKKAGISPEQARAQIDAELAREYGVRPAYLTPKELTEGSSFLQNRQYENVVDNPTGPGRVDMSTLLALKRSKFGGDWETQFGILYNQMYHNAQKWDFQRRIVEEMKKTGSAIDVRGMTPEQIQMKLGGDFRMLKAENVWKLLDAKGIENPFAGLAVSGDVWKWYAKTMTGMSPMLLESPGLQKFVNAVEGFRRWFSAWTLLPFPSYHVRNIAGDLTRSMMEGFDLEDIESHKFAWSIAKPTKDESNFPLLVREQQRVLSEQEMARFARGGEQAAAPDYIAQKIDKWKSMAQDNDALGRSIDRESMIHYLYANVIEHNIRDVDEISDAGALQSIPFTEGSQLQKIANKIGKATQYMPLVGTDSNRLLQFAGKWGTSFSNFHRVDLWAQTVERALADGITDMRGAFEMGNDAVRRALFNYSDLTDVERHVFKNINFFYTYMARSLPFHVEKMIARPDLIAPYARAYNALWGNVEDEGFRPEDMRDFLTEQMGLPLYKGEDEEGNESYVVWSPTNWIGIADVNEVAEWARSFMTVLPGGAEVDSAGMLQALGMNLNPVLKGIIETMTQKDMMTGRDLSNREYVDVLGMPMPTPAARLVRNIRLVSELDRLNPGGVFTKLAKSKGYIVDERAHRHEAPETERWVQLWSGLRLFGSTPSVDLQRNVLDTVHEISDVESRMRRATFSGNLYEMRRNSEVMQEQLLPELDALNERLRYWQAKKSEKAHQKAAQISNRVP